MKCGNVHTKIYPVVSVGTKPPLVHIVEALYLVLLGNQVSSRILLDLPQRLCQVTAVTLIPLSTKELLHEVWGLPCPLHKAVVASPH